MSNTPTAIANQALDAAGVDFTLGDIEEGTRPAQVCLRAYGQCLRQLLRTARWGFARKCAPLLLLADASGQTKNVGSVVPVPWLYEYAYPTDCVQARFVPLNQQAAPAQPAENYGIGTVPLLATMAPSPVTGQRIIPARFLVATDFNYPPDQAQNAQDVQGVSPQGRTVILTNVPNAQLIYTSLVLYPNIWDALFRGAMVAYLASEIAVPLAKDKKLGLVMQTRQIEIVRKKVEMARIADGNEGVTTVAREASWITARRTGGPWRGDSGGDGLGVLYYQNEALAFADGSAY